MILELRATMIRSLLFLVVLLTGTVLRAQAPQTIYSYAIGDWRNGPVVVISPLFETTEAFTTPQLIARVKAEYPAFKDITDIDIQRFATVEEGQDSRRVLKSKYLRRELKVDLLEGPFDK
jgi:hypothetical protein